MRRMLMRVTILFAMLIVGITAIFYISDKNEDPEYEKSVQVVSANEIEQLIRSGHTEEAAEQAEQLKTEIRELSVGKDDTGRLFIMCGVSLGFGLLVSLYIYLAIIRPFNKMQVFANQIARGDFDVPLNYERTNYFGSFTWAFDSMRREITKSRACEREAIVNNKTVIATLSHDIKTPISSIRAYAEGLEANMDNSPEKRRKYLSVIMRKCDEVSKLTNDLFLHSISDLEKLKMVPERFEICGFVMEALAELSAEHNDIVFEKPCFSADVMADKKRLLQLIENIINNARKYAKTEINARLEMEDGCVRLCLRDHGNGIPDEDMPFIFEKFYRGHNSGDEQGSGLGLYIVKYIADKMNGKVALRNLKDGLEVTLELPCAD